MPQEIRVVQCFDCKIYQVDLVKKVNKWTCKVCNAKQSLRAELFRGSGPACRARVQELNKQREVSALNQERLALEFDENLDCDLAFALKQNTPLPVTSKSDDEEVAGISKWSNFVDKEIVNSEPVKGNNDKIEINIDAPFCFHNKQKWTTPKYEATGRDGKRSSVENDVFKSSKKSCKWDSYL